MARSDDLHALGEEIETSHDVRRATVDDIAREAQETTERFRQEHQQRAEEVQRTLEEHRQEQEQTAQETRQTLDNFEREVKQEEQARRQEFFPFEMKIKETVAGIEQYTHDLLSGFAGENRRAHDRWANHSKTMEAKRAAERPQEQRKGETTHFASGGQRKR